MTLVKCFLFALLVIIVPIAVGGFPAAFVKEQKKSIGFMWISGCMTVWALFQVLCVYAVFERGDEGYHFLRKYFLIGMAVLVLVGVLTLLISFGIDKKKQPLQSGEGAGSPKQSRRKMGTGEKIGYLLFGLLLLFQLVMAVCYTYGDGDDAYYVAVSTLTESSKTLYKLMPYSMGSTTMDIRHSLAPFPVWIALLADYCDLRTVMVAHSMLPPVLITMTYVIFYKIGEILFANHRERIPYFLSMASLLILFGDTSFYTVENFMIARSRQGKAALGSIILPMMLYLILAIFQRIQKKEKTGWMLHLVLLQTVTAACLCTTLGTFLSCVLIGILGFCGAIAYRKGECIWKMALPCVPAVVFAYFYLML